MASSTTLKISIRPESSNVSVQLLNPTYDSFFRALATSVFAQHTGFNLGFGCGQYNPAPNEDLVVGLHNFTNHKIQVGLAKWLRMYIGGHALKQLEIEKGSGFTKDMREGDFSDLKNDGKCIPSLQALLNFFGEMYSAMLTSDFGRIHLPEDLTMKFNEFIQPPMSKSAWIHHTRSWDETKSVMYASEFLKDRNVCVFTPEQNVSEKISFSFYNSSSMYSGMIPPPPDIDRYGDKSGTVQIKLSPNAVLSNGGSMRMSERDALENFHCLLKTRHSFDGKIYDGYHVIFPLTVNHVDMSRRRRYYDITKELVRNLPRTLQSRILMNYADVEILAKSESASSSSARGTGSGSGSGSASSVRGTGSGSASSVRGTGSGSGSGSASSVRGMDTSSVRGTGTGSASSVRGTGSGSGSGSASSVRGTGSIVAKSQKNAAFSDDDNDGEEDTVEKKKSMDALVKNAFNLGTQRNEKEERVNTRTLGESTVYKMKGYCSEDSPDDFDE